MNFPISWSDTSTWLLSDTRTARHTIDYAVSFIQNQQPFQPQIYFGTSASYILLWKSQWMNMGRSFVLWIYLVYKLRGHSICILKLLWLFRFISLLKTTIYSLLSIRTLLIYILSLPCTIWTQDSVERYVGLKWSVQHCYCLCIYSTKFEAMMLPNPCCQTTLVQLPRALYKMNPNKEG